MLEMGFVPGNMASEGLGGPDTTKACDYPKLCPRRGILKAELNRRFQFLAHARLRPVRKQPSRVPHTIGSIDRCSERCAHAVSVT